MDAMTFVHQSLAHCGRAGQWKLAKNGAIVSVTGRIAAQLDGCVGQDGRIPTTAAGTMHSQQQSQVKSRRAPECWPGAHDVIVIASLQYAQSGAAVRGEKEHAGTADRVHLDKFSKVAYARSLKIIRSADS